MGKLLSLPGNHRGIGSIWPVLHELSSKIRHIRHPDSLMRGGYQGSMSRSYFIKPDFGMSLYVVGLLISDVAVHERTHHWRWATKEELIRFLTRDNTPSMLAYMSSWTPEQKQEVAVVIGQILNDDFGGREPFHVAMVANIVVGRKK
jgi:hypothetical protein